MVYIMAREENNHEKIVGDSLSICLIITSELSNVIIGIFDIVAKSRFASH